MRKRPNLADVAAAAGSARRAAPERAPAPALAPAAAAAPGPVKARDGTKQISGHFPAEVAWQLRGLALERRTTVQALVGEALNLLLARYGKPPVDMGGGGRP